MMLTSAPLLAQTAPEPSALERTIPRETKEKPVDPSIRTNLPAVESGPTIQGRFILGAVHVSGSTAFSGAELAAVYEPYLATEVDDARLKDMVAKITALYREAGYPLSYAMLPAQDVRAGVVRIDIVEGTIATVAIDGAEGSTRALEKIAAPLIAEKPLRTATLERVLGLMRDLPGFYVADVRVARAGNGLAEHHLTIRVLRNKIRALVYSDNRGTVAKARFRLYSSLGMAALLTTGDELRLTGFAIPGDGFRYFYGQAAYSFPLGRSGLALDLSGSYGNQHQRASSVSVDGTSTNFSALFRYPVVRSRNFTMVAKAGVSDWRSVSDHDVTRLQRDRLRVARLGVGISNVASGQTDADFWLSRGLGFDAATRPGDPLASRPDGGGKFTKASFIVQTALPIDASFTLRANLSGQYSSRPLLSVEEFALGGGQIGRAYDFNSLTGDHGFGGALEIGYRLGKAVGPAKQVELFGFLDGGAAFQDGDPVGISRRQALASTGAGARFSIAGVNISAEGAIPFYAIARMNGLRAFVSASTAF
jgi:hemolysin activation/secretion protein